MFRNAIMGLELLRCFGISVENFELFGFRVYGAGCWD